MRWFISALLTACFIAQPVLADKHHERHDDRDHRSPAPWIRIEIPVRPIVIEPIPIFVLPIEETEDYDAQLRLKLPRLKDRLFHRAMTNIAARSNLSADSKVQVKNLLDNPKFVHEFARHARLMASRNAQVASALAAVPTPANPRPLLNWLENGGAQWLYQVFCEIAQLYGIHLPNLPVLPPIPHAGFIPVI